MGHLGDTAFLPGQKPILPGHVGDTAFLLRQKKISPHSKHTISNRQTCQKEKNV